MADDDDDCMIVEVVPPRCNQPSKKVPNVAIVSADQRVIHLRDDEESDSDELPSMSDVLQNGTSYKKGTLLEDAMVASVEHVHRPVSDVHVPVAVHRVLKQEGKTPARPAQYDDVISAVCRVKVLCSTSLLDSPRRRGAKRRRASHRRQPKCFRELDMDAPCDAALTPVQLDTDVTALRRERRASLAKQPVSPVPVANVCEPVRASPASQAAVTNASRCSGVNDAQRHVVARYTQTLSDITSCLAKSVQLPHSGSLLIPAGAQRRHVSVAAVLEVVDLQFTNGEENKLRYARELMATLRAGFRLNVDMLQRLVVWLCNEEASSKFRSQVVTVFSQAMESDPACACNLDWYWQAVEEYLFSPSSSPHSQCYASVLQLTVLALACHCNACKTATPSVYPLCPVRYRKRVERLLEALERACSQNASHAKRLLSTLLSMLTIQYGVTDQHLHQRVVLVCRELCSICRRLPEAQHASLFRILPQFLSFRTARMVLEDTNWPGSKRLTALSASSTVEELVARYCVLFPTTLPSNVAQRVVPALTVVVTSLGHAGCHFSPCTVLWLKSLASAAAGSSSSSPNMLQLLADMLA